MTTKYNDTDSYVLNVTEISAIKTSVGSQAIFENNEMLVDFTLKAKVKIDGKWYKVDAYFETVVEEIE